MWINTVAPVMLSFLVVKVLSEEIMAVALLKTYSTSTVHNPSGNVTFIQHDDGTVTVKGFVQGMKKTTAGPHEHGFHIHEKGDLREGCASLGGHYNPQQKQHGGPNHEIRHIGDLGNIEVLASGIGSFEFEDKIISLTGPYSIIGRGVVIHSDKDDLGKRTFNDSLVSGHSGTRYVCGVIGLLSPIYSSSLQITAQCSTIVLSLIALKLLF